MSPNSPVGDRPRRARRMPRGLFGCKTCGKIRGKTPEGMLSVCLCQGVRCTRCGEVSRRPITDYYDPRSHSWWHVPYFALMGHGCPSGRQLAAGERGWEALPIDDDVRAYRDATTRETWAEVAERFEARSRGEKDVGILWSASWRRGDRDHRDGK